LPHTYSPRDMKANVLLLLLLFTSQVFRPAAAQSTAKTGQAPTKGLFAQPQLVHEFKIAVPQQRLDDIMAKVKAARLPRQMPPAEGSDSNWQTGMDMKWMEELRQYWLTSYNWRDQEKKLNSYPQYMANVDGYDIQFYYIKGEGKNPLPLLLTHGWPGSTFEFFDAIEPLTHPSKFGGKAEDAFTLIIPALPGFGFSSMPKVPVQGKTTARLWHKLVTEIIGHKQFVAQGGDWGAGATVQLAHDYPESVKAIHLNLFVWFPVPVDQQTPAEKKYFAESDAFMAAGFDYWRMQANKPMMPAVALYDSPLGTAGWIAEKFWSWTDNNGNLDSVIPKDKLLTDIMLYLVNDGGIDGSFWYYRGVYTEMKGVTYPGYINTPTAIAKYPKDLVMTRPPLETAKRGYNIVRFEDMPKGGHFAAMEQPLLFAKDVREAFHAYH
jgi:pimeloyl-ACP methyl ester carboxylesterase